jgi:hypothetical protein
MKSMYRGMFVLLAGAVVVPLAAADNSQQEQRGSHSSQTVLYAGPLAHDTEWKITAGTVKNDIYHAFGGTCSMVPSDVRNMLGSASEHVTFEAKPEPEGIWDMAWTDSISGKAAAATGQKYVYTYQQRFTFKGTTTDGRAPRPNRGIPSPDDRDGFLQIVPSNVNADALDLNDFFLLEEEIGGKLIASSHVHFIWRLKITPTEQPPAFFPFVLQGYILGSIRDQLAGQLGCDPL